MNVLLLLTGLSTATSLVCAYLAIVNRQAAEAAELRLKLQLTNIVSMDAAIESLSAQLRKLNGKFHASLYHERVKRAGPAEEFGDAVDQMPLAPEVLGPTSPVCRCGWCQACQQRKLAASQQ